MAPRTTPAPGAPIPPVDPALTGGAPGASSTAEGAADLGRAEAENARLNDIRDRDAALRVDTIAEAAALLGTDPLPLPNGGPGVGAAHVAERQDGFVLRSVGTVAEARLAGAVDRRDGPRVAPVTKEVLPRTDRAVDPDTVPGTRFALVTSQLRRNGLTYQPGEEVEVDFRAHGELLIIGAIEPTSWSDLASWSELEHVGES